jgi:hypothetical protein
VTHTDESIRIEAALDKLVSTGLARQACLLRLPGNVAPWTSSGIHIDRGDQVTWLADGRVILPPGIPGNGRPASHLWVRLTLGGLAQKAAQDTHTFRAEQSGDLELGILLGEWSTKEGGFETPSDAWSATRGELDVVIIHWGSSDPATGLERLETILGGDALANRERARLAEPPVRPPNWSPHWLIGEGGVFYTDRCGDRPCMNAKTKDDVAIIRTEIDSAVGPDTTLHWNWRIDELPSALPEDQLFQHDYISIAAEFDCGRDLTWYWSSSLPVETWFTCPIPQWAPRETHCVVRSGEAGLGEWHSERRLLALDYRTALGSEPGRLVAVWLIAVSLFQHGEGRGWFADIAIEHEGRRIEIPTC